MHGIGRFPQERSTNRMIIKNLQKKVEKSKQEYDNYFEKYGTSGKDLTQFLMFRDLGENLEDKIKRLFFMFYE